MRLSKGYMKTYKKFPYENALESTKLLYRSGMVKFFEDASFSYTPMGKLFADRLKSRLKSRFKDHMDVEIGYGEEKNIRGYSDEIKSYKEIPLHISYESIEENKKYKFKDGLLNPKADRQIHFVSLSGEEDAMRNYEIMKEQMGSFLNGLGIEHECLESEEGATLAAVVDYPLESFMYCGNCGYGGKADRIKSAGSVELSTEKELEPEKVHTPGIGTIGDLERFFEAGADMFIKTLLFDVEGEIVAVLLRGDRSISTRLLASYLGVGEESVVMASEEQVKDATSAEVGFAGPIGIKVDKMICDEQVCKMKNAIVGANETDYHIKNVNYKRDFEVDDVGFFKEAQEKDLCHKDGNALEHFQACGVADLKVSRQSSRYLNNSGREEDLFKVSVKVRLDRLFALVAEKNIDELGIAWPDECAPFEYYVIVGNVKKDEEVSAGERIYSALLERGKRVILDDRKERIGSKFKDSELLGVKNVIVAGKLVYEGNIEIKNREEGSKREVSIEDFISDLGAV